MAFDTGVNRQTQVNSDEDQERRDAALKTYYDEVEIVTSKIAIAQAQLEQVLASIDQQKKDWDDLHQKSISDHNADIAILSEQKDQLLAQINDLENDIKAKSTERDAILSDFSSQRADLDAQQMAVDNKLQKLLILTNKSDDRIKAAEAAEAALVQKISDFNRDCDAKTKVLADLQASINEQRAALDKAQAAQTDHENALADREADMMARQTEFNAQVAAAQVILSQADDVRKQSEQNKIDADNNARLALQNESDANQIIEAKLALINKTQELNVRERTLANAEQKIGG